MVKFDVAELRSKIDVAGKYVDFNSVRTSVTVLSLAELFAQPIGQPSKEGECRANCPKCKKTRCFALNINTNRFNCFNTSCKFKGSGVIDFTQKLFEVAAKEAAHLIACAYGIQPYSSDNSGVSKADTKEINVESREDPEQITEPINNSDFVTQAEFNRLKEQVANLSTLVWSLMFETGRVKEGEDLFETEPEIDQEKAISA